ncbi:MAG: hypothetical protein COA66_10420 [Arcobacter sp.]|nr:MAG: hypothetical protein COA66_10420 [Arcobacter sp.]
MVIASYLKLVVFAIKVFSISKFTSFSKNTLLKFDSYSSIEDAKDILSLNTALPKFTPLIKIAE